jgi:tetratricopeptide (TPR) repeat protein
LSALALVLLAAHAAAPTMVLPPSGPDADSAWIAEAVADGLPEALEQLGVPVVDRADRLRAHETLEIPAQNLTRATSVRIAEALGASRIVLGSYELAQDQLTLSLRLLDVARGALSLPLRVAGPLDTLAPLLRGLAWDIALSGSEPPSVARDEFVRRAPAIPFEALRYHARGLAAPDAAARVRLLKQALALYPGYDAARLSLGRLQVAARDSAAAVDNLGRVSAGSPVARKARFLQGVALLDLGRYKEAAAVCAGLTAPEPTAAVLNNYALALLRLGPAAPAGVKASDALRKAIDLDPGIRELRFNLGWALLIEGEPEAAAFWMRGVLREAGGDAHAQVVLSWALRRAGRAAEADEQWKQVLAGAPSYESLATPDPARRFERVLPWEQPLVFDEERWGDRQYAASHLGRGEKLVEAGDLDGALRELTQAAVLDPYADRIHALLARTERRAGNAEKAVGEFRMALWVRDDAPVRAELMSLLQELGRVAEARAEAAKVLKADPGNAAARKLLGRK